MAILHVDPDAEKVRLLTRIESGGWEDAELETGQDVIIEELGVNLTWAEIFSR